MERDGLASVRVASVNDSLRIGQIHVEGWRAAYRGIVPDTFLAGLSVEKRAAGWRYAIEKDPRGLFVFERGKTIHGWVAIGKARDGINHTGEVYALYVDPSTWRQGCGRALLKTAETELWSRGYRSSVLWVLERNIQARNFYQLLGYNDDGGRKSERIDGTELIEMRMSKLCPLRRNAG
jgi:ribosomal protein S18 acetylase RimI-like enzyme